MLEVIALDTVVGGLPPACKADVKAGAVIGAVAGLIPGLGDAIPTMGASLMIPVVSTATTAFSAYISSQNCRYGR